MHPHACLPDVLCLWYRLAASARLACTFSLQCPEHCVKCDCFDFAQLQGPPNISMVAQDPSTRTLQRLRTAETLANLRISAVTVATACR